MTRLGVRSSVVLLLTALAVSVATAQSAEYTRCLAAAQGNNNQRFNCNQQELRRQDKRVDADYRKMQIAAQHDPQKQADVRTDQRNWLQHRDGACAKGNDAENLPCMIRETAAKADQLDARLH